VVSSFYGGFISDEVIYELQGEVALLMLIITRILALSSRFGNLIQEQRILVAETGYKILDHLTEDEVIGYYQDTSTPPYLRGYFHLILVKVSGLALVFELCFIHEMSNFVKVIVRVN
jgi:hypothetical protein